jgi:ligand-binding SRPBCC domain-containing protein
MSYYQLRKQQFISAPVRAVWDFISSPHNLKVITPEYMGFEITSESLPGKMYPGMIIPYTVKPLLGIKMVWVTEITHIEEMKYFIDEQRIGPYSMWHHQHFIESSGEGVLMTDIVTYSPPLGFIGALLNHLFIRKKLDSIFSYRSTILQEHFTRNPGR